MSKYFKTAHILSGALIALTAITAISGCDRDDCPVNSRSVITTVERTIIPVPVSVFPGTRIDDPGSFAKYGYGEWEYGPGLPLQKRIDRTPAGYDPKGSENGKTLLHFFAMTDVHCTDKETPAQGIFFRKYAGANSVSCYAPVMLYSTQVLDAAVRTINRLNRESVFDFGISLGDMANSAQYNEIRWFIDVMDGKYINPDSGIKDDPIPGTGNDYQDEFQAEGLDKSIKWYATIGNHDHLWMGVKPINDKIRQAFTGNKIIQTGNIFTDPLALDKNTFSMGTFDGSTLYGTIIGEGVVSSLGEIPDVAPDPDRRPLTRDEVMEELSKSTTLPAGHGFVQDNPENQFRNCYSVEPKANLPLKLIVLDDTQDESDPELYVFGKGSLENGRHDWLIAQLKKGQEEGKLMIIAAHVPIGVAAGQLGWYNTKVESDLIAELKTFPNLILWIAGHRHLNTVTALASTDLDHPENGFWEVETKSLREFPQQFRTFDIIFNSDNTLSIKIINVDPEVKDGSLAAISRSYAIASAQIYNQAEILMPTGSRSYNAELIKVLTPEMQSRISDYVKSHGK